MSRLSVRRTDDELDELSKRFDQWRATRSSPREPIPQPLWDEAARLSRRLRISHVAKALRLSAGDLKRRRDGSIAPSTVASAGSASTATTVFVPVITPEAVAVPGAEIEVHRVDGTRLCIRYPGGGAPIGDVVRAFLAS